MADDLGIDIGTLNPVAYAHLQLRGGWKNIAVTCGVYALAVGALMFASIRFDPPRISTVLSVWASVLLIVQTALLTFLGCTTINAAIRTDITSRMMESHRLMPVSPASIILGYLIGAPCQFLAMAVVTFFFGWVASGGASLPLMRWPVANGILGAFALLLWLGVIFFAFSVRNGVRWFQGVAIAIVCTRGIALSVLPGLTLLVSPLIHRTIYDASTWSSQLNPEYMLAIAAQALLGGIFFVAAARRFRRPDRPAMGSVLALLLLGACVAISCVGIYRWDEIRPMFSPRDMESAQLVTTLAACILLAMLPVAAANWADAEWRRLRTADDPTPQRRPVSPLLMPLLAATIVLPLTLMPSAEPQLGWQQARLRTWLSIFLILLALSYMQRMLYRLRTGRTLLTGIFVVLAWLGPFLAAAITYAVTDVESGTGFSPTIIAASPLGMMICLWFPDPHAHMNTNPGLIFQAALAAVMAILFYRPMVFKQRSAL